MTYQCTKTTAKQLNSVIKESLQIPIYTAYIHVLLLLHIHSNKGRMHSKLSITYIT